MSGDPARAPRIRDGVRAGLPLAPNPVIFGLSFGVLADSAGVGAIAATTMSATTFAGSAQFAAVSVLDAGGTALAAIATALFLNARYAAISISVATIFPGGTLRRVAQSQLIVDESWALSGRGGRFEWPILVGVGLLFYVLWVGSTLAGSVLGGALENPNALGLDTAFAVLFFGLALPYLRSRRAIGASFLAAAIVLVLLPVAPVGIPLVAAAAASLLGLRR